MNEKGRKKLTWWACPFGVLAYYKRLKINEVETDILGYIVEQYAANNAYSAKRCSVSVSQAELKKIANTKGNRQIQAAIKHLQSMSLIDCTDKGNGRKAAKYKVIDEKLLPDKLRKKPP